MHPNFSPGGDYTGQIKGEIKFTQLLEKLNVRLHAMEALRVRGGIAPTHS
jgi:hypothetical protein